MTAEAGQAKQQQTQVGQQENACKKTSDLYTQHAQVFDRNRAAHDPQLALVELRIAVWGTNDRITSSIGQQMEREYDRTLYQYINA